MNKKVTFLSLICSLSLAFIGSQAFAQTISNPYATWEISSPSASAQEMSGTAYTEDMSMNPYATWEISHLRASEAIPVNAYATGWHPLEASWLIGVDVYGYNNDYVGNIDDLVIDQANHRIVLVVLSDVPYLRAGKVAIPYSCFERTGEYSFKVRLPSDGLGSIQWFKGPDQYFLTQAPVGIPFLTSGSGVYDVPAKIDDNWVEYIYTYYGQDPYWKHEGAKPIADMELFTSRRLIGASVQTSNGEAVGMVSDLVINSSDGHIRLVALSDVRGRGDSLVAVPSDCLTRTGEATFALSISDNELASAPSFNPSADMNSRTYAEHVYRSFGLEPYWTD
jgi:sporulation protein YlmC with PRC-barrel domain